MEKQIRPNAADAAWFRQTFDAELSAFNTKAIAAYTGRFSFDVIAFDAFLKEKHGYPDDDGISIADFVTEKFGSENYARLRQLLSH